MTTQAQRKDNTLGYVKNFGPLLERLEGGDFHEVTKQLQSLITSIRSLEEYGRQRGDDGNLLNEETFHQCHSSIRRDKLEIITTISNL